MKAVTPDPLIESIRQLTPPHPVDVTDAVMQRIRTMPTVVDFQSAVHTKRRRRITIVSTAAAACVAGAILVVSALSGNSIQAATPATPELEYRITEVYHYCDCYADEDESAAIYDNIVTDLL